MTSSKERPALPVAKELIGQEAAPPGRGVGTKDRLAQKVAEAVGAGEVAELKTVDFNDPNRPKTCLEVDFPILPVNALSAIEASSGSTKKPIYQIQKWWARRQPSVFRALLIAAAARAPDDPAHAARRVWDHYYANHQQQQGTFRHLKVADIFMGGGTTLVEGSRLGMQMVGNDLNPVAWFVVKQALANVDLEQVHELLADIEAEVRPQIMPFYACDGPDGERGTWTHEPTGQAMPEDFDPLTIPRAEREDYDYRGPEAIYTFWAKHGLCQVTGCGHRTPIMASPVLAVKTLSIRYWPHTCGQCRGAFDIEEKAARMAPDAPRVVAPTETPFSVLDLQQSSIVCPHCGDAGVVSLSASARRRKKVTLSLLVHPQWLAGAPGQGPDGQPWGGAAQDDAASSARWNEDRAREIRLLEVRGALPEEVTCPETEVTFETRRASKTGKGKFACAACGAVQDVLATVKATSKTAPVAAYAVQGYAPQRAEAGRSLYRGRFFAAFDAAHAGRYDAACAEWEARKETDLKDYWPRSETLPGEKSTEIQSHQYTHWWTMFNPRQLLVHAQLLKAIVTVGDYDWPVREYVLGAFQQYLRNQNMYAFWNIQADQLEPMFSNNHFHPKSSVIENGVFATLGRGNWASCTQGLLEGRDWAKQPWETVSVEDLKLRAPDLAEKITGKSTKVFPGDPVTGAEVCCGSTTGLALADASLDLVITDPPFGGLLNYSELSDFFHVWLRLVLKDKYPEAFGPEYTPKALEAVANRVREPDPDGFYQRLLTQCWREAHRALKPGGMLAFTFHHSEDAPWVAVLESLFDAGFYLEATYPIRSDETKGEGEFGSQKIEYDIIHVCRKRTGQPEPVSWGRMRREVLTDVGQLKTILENHAEAGLPEADLQVIRRGKALEYFSRHYGQVYVDEERTLSVKEALLGINQLIAEDAGQGREPPPVEAEPVTRQFLQTFGDVLTLPRDQLQKLLRGTAIAPDEFVKRGWCYEEKKLFMRTDPLAFAKGWVGKQRSRLICDLDQALVLIGACVEGSGINASKTLKNNYFKPSEALGPLLEWLHKNGPDETTQGAALRAGAIFESWQKDRKRASPRQTSLLDGD